MEEHTHEHEHTKSKNDQNQIVGAIIIAGFLIAGAILLKGNGPSPANTNTGNTANNTTFQGRPVSSNDHILGNPKAKVVIVEYSDLECPFCKTFHNTMLRVVKESNGEVAWVFRHYPIPQLHSKATREAEATECAFAQGGNDAFWKYTNRLFEVTPSNDGLDDAELPKIAQYTGLDVATFNDCLANGEQKTKVEAYVADGGKAGVRGTPSSFILVKGKFLDTIPGALPYEDVMEILGGIK